jgi:hypothetical protein
VNAERRGKTEFFIILHPAVQFQVLLDFVALRKQSKAPCKSTSTLLKVDGSGNFHYSKQKGKRRWRRSCSTDEIEERARPLLKIQVPALSLCFLLKINDNDSA